MIRKILRNDYVLILQSALVLLFFLFFTTQRGSAQTSELRKIRNFDHHTYEVISEPMSWSDAKEYALAKSGALVKIETFQEQIFLRSLMKDTITTAADGGGAKYFWLGGSDAQIEGSWKWADGSEIIALSITTNDLWGKGQGFEAGLSEPDNFMENQHCLAMGLESWPAGATDSEAFGSAGQWNDICLLYTSDAADE